MPRIYQFLAVDMEPRNEIRPSSKEKMQHTTHNDCPHEVVLVEKLSMSVAESAVTVIALALLADRLCHYILTRFVCQVR